VSLCFNWAPRHEDVLREWRYSSTHSLTSALDGGEWSASCPGRFTPRDRSPGTHWIWSWVGPRAVLDAVVKRNIPSLRWESNPRTPIVQPVAAHYSNWAITASTNFNDYAFLVFNLLLISRCTLFLLTALASIFSRDLVLKFSLCLAKYHVMKAYPLLN
jgi:hypothetical protein